VKGDLNAFLLTGRTNDIRRVFGDAQDAERLGVRRVFVAERYDIREAGALLGGVAAVTSTVEVGTGAVIPAARSPLMTAALGATMQTAYGSRFNLGIGRGIDSHLAGQGMAAVGWAYFADYVDIVRRLWAGETITYDGPVGSFDGLKLVEDLAGPSPGIWVMIVGGEVGCRRAAEIGDAVMLSPFLTPEAVHTAVTTIRARREQLDLDPAITICHPIVTAPDLDDTTTLELTRSRLVGYLWMPVLGQAYARLNHWDTAPMTAVREHPQFQQLSRANVDQSFRLSDLHAPAEAIPEEWVRETAAIGNVDECVKTLRVFRDAGADELAIYGSSPAQNAELIAAWSRAS
jgi:5,10-methylenetetrahydromethanopterin reductase